MSTTTGDEPPAPVVIVGSGFGGLFAAQALKHADVDVTLIAKTSHHLFQPLLYQVATGILSQGEIAPATREILTRQPNARVMLGEVTQIDIANKIVTSQTAGLVNTTPYDSLILAAGVDPVVLRQRPFRRLRARSEVRRRRPRASGQDLRGVRAGELSTDPAEVTG